MLKRIRAEDLQVGMFVEDFNTPWIHHPFFRSRRPIHGPKEIRTILDHGISEVTIDTSKGRDSPKAYLPQEAEGNVPERMEKEAGEGPGSEGVRPEEGRSDEIPFDQELRRAIEVYDEAKGVVKNLFEEARLGRAVRAEHAREAVQKMIDSLFRNRDALLSLSRLKAFDGYTFHHSLNVALLSLGLGTQLGILDSELLRLGLGALLHDLGKVRVPEHLIRREGTLEPHEYEVVKTHAAHGAKMLLASHSIPEECAAVALNHHERYDASGYPRALRGAAIGKFGLISGIADVYDAMTSDRPYQKAFTGHEALKRAYLWSGTLFHPLYVQKFIQCMGIYPVGSIVRLDNGEVGVVSRQNRNDPLRPWVRIVRGSDGRVFAAPEDRDLRDPDPDGARPFARAVESVLDPATSGVDVIRILAPRDVPRARLSAVMLTPSRARGLQRGPPP